MDDYEYTNVDAIYEERFCRECDEPWLDDLYEDETEFEDEE